VDEVLSGAWRRAGLAHASCHELLAPRVDEHSAMIITEAVDALAALRTTYWLGDSAVHLHALASLIAQAQRLPPDAIHDAREQEHSWTEIGQLLILSPAALHLGDEEAAEPLSYSCAPQPGG
jgi:hypothetical protein